MKIAISAETTADFTKELIEQYGIFITPFTITLGDRSDYDGVITGDDIIEYVNKTGKLCKTSAINAFQYTEHFNNILKEYDAVIHFSISSELSSACNNAKSVADTMKNVYVIDSRSLSTGIALLAIYAKELVEQGESAQTVYEKCLNRVPSVQASFILKRVDYLYKGGRCSMLSFLGANLLKIRPQIIVKEGKMISGKKYRGNYAHGVNTYCDDVLAQFNTPDLNHGFVTYTTASPEIVENAIQKLKDAGFRNIHVTRAGGTITTHCGEDCLGILYLNDGKQ